MQSIYGIHSLILLDKDSHLPVSFLKAVGSANLELSGESTQLEGGSSLYPLDSEVSKISSKCSMTVREYPIEAMEKLLGGTKTIYASNAAGQIVDKLNIKGTSGTDLTVGLSSGDSADLKGGEYVVVFTGAAACKIYAMSDIGGGEFDDSNLLDIEGAITLSSSAYEVAGYGITLAGPATPAFVSGDSVRFRVIEPNKTGEKLKVGALSSTFNEFSALVYAQKRGGNKMVYIELYKVKVYGMPISFEEKKFSEWQVDMEVLYDDVRDGVFEFVRQY